MLNPRGPNFLRSMAFPWKKHRESRRDLNLSACFANRECIKKQKITAHLGYPEETRAARQQTHFTCQCFVALSHWKHTSDGQKMLKDLQMDSRIYIFHTAHWLLWKMNCILYMQLYNHNLKWYTYCRPILCGWADIENGTAPAKAFLIHTRSVFIWLCFMMAAGASYPSIPWHRSWGNRRWGWSRISWGLLWSREGVRWSSWSCSGGWRLGTYYWADWSARDGNHDEPKERGGFSCKCKIQKYFNILFS